MLAGLNAVLRPAAETGRAVGAFNVFSLEHAEAIVSGAEGAGLPVVLQISENAVRYHGALEPILLATLTLARNASVPVVVHLDHITGDALARLGIDLGATSVMFDASRLAYEANVAATAALVEYAHERGVAVEAELGEIAGKDGTHAPSPFTEVVRTDPVEAAEFVAATGIDALAVAVGSSHAMIEATAVLEFELIEALRTSVPVPLVLHGASGVPDTDLVVAARTGMTKINIATQLNVAFTGAVRRALRDDPDLVDSRRYLAPARDAVAAEVSRLLRLLGG